MSVRPIDGERLMKSFISGQFYTGLSVHASILQAPRLDYAPVRHATWVQDGEFDEEANVYTCSLCGEDWQLNAGNPEDNNMNYCPNCGAKMRNVGGVNSATGELGISPPLMRCA